MDLTLLWIALAAFGGALLHLIFQGTTSWKQTLITGFITAIGYAVGLNFSGSMSILLIFSAILGGYGVNAAVSAVRQKNMVTQFKNKYPDWKNKMNQPK